MSKPPAPAEEPLRCRVRPSGRIEAFREAAGECRLSKRERQLAKAFARGRGIGLLELALTGMEDGMDAGLAFFQEFGRLFLSSVCAVQDPTDASSLPVPDPEPDRIAAMAAAVPPMPGAELVTQEMLRSLWLDLAAALDLQTKSYDDGLREFLEERGSVFRVVGRVCLHLAENKKSELFPFAFVATYVDRVSNQAAPRHLRLAAAREMYAGEENRAKLLALLAPLSRAAEESAFLKAMIDSGEIYHAISFTADQAHRFLRELPIYERSGLVVRVPDFWQTRRPPRPRVTVTVGGKPPARLGMEALLDFDVKVTIGGVKMTRREIAKILASTEGLQFIKGRWVEVNREELEATLDRWKSIQEEARLRGIGFGEAMRLPSGVGLGEAEGADAAAPDWSEIVTGKWLAGKLEALRSPALLRELADDAGLRATLRPYQREGVQWLLALRGLELGGCLADDMGLGKTIQILAVLNIGHRSKDGRSRERSGAPPGVPTSNATATSRTGCPVAAPTSGTAPSST